MAYETLIVAYDQPDPATEAVRAIRRLGVPSAGIKRHPVDAGSIADTLAAPDDAEDEADRAGVELDRYGPLDVAAAGQP